MIVPAIPFVILLLGGSAPTAPPAPRAAVVWGTEGHRIVALLAEPLLTPTARAKVHALLGNRSLVSVANWADSIRQSRPETAPLHYVNIPLLAAAYDSARDCPDGQCIIHAIGEDRRILADSTADRARRVEALEFLVHFMADLHQPLHCVDDHDRGGNAVRVVFRGRRTNLHAVWDTWLLEATGSSDADLVARLRHEMDSMNLKAVREGTVVEWAEESHRLAEGAYRIPGDARLGRAYQRAELPVVYRQLIRAGVRLAEVLNQALR